MMVKVLIYTYNSSYSPVPNNRMDGGGGVATDNNKWKKGGGVDKKFKKNNKREGTIIWNWRYRSSEVLEERT